MGAPYDSLVVADGAARYLRLDDTSGTTAVASVGSDGSYVGSPTLNQAGPVEFGRPDKSVGFNGSSNYVEVGAVAGLSVSTAQSFEWWQKNDTIISNTWPSGNSGIIIGTNNDTSAVLAGAATGSLANEVITVSNEGGGAGDRTGWSGFTIPTGWHHYVLTYSGTQNGWTLFIDGLDVTGSAWGGTKIAASGGAFGFSAAWTQYLAYSPAYGGGPKYQGWSGMAAFAVYNAAALSAVQARSHYWVGQPLWRDGGSRAAMVMG